jgi:hypothetical protein
MMRPAPRRARCSVQRAAGRHSPLKAEARMRLRDAHAARRRGRPLRPGCTQSLAPLTTHTRTCAADRSARVVGWLPGRGPCGITSDGCAPMAAAARVVSCAQALRIRMRLAKVLPSIPGTRLARPPARPPARLTALPPYRPPPMLPSKCAGALVRPQPDDAHKDLDSALLLRSH